MSERGRKNKREGKETGAWEEGMKEAGRAGRMRREEKVWSIMFFHSFIQHIFIISLGPGMMLVLGKH